MVLRITSRRPRTEGGKSPLALNGRVFAVDFGRHSTPVPLPRMSSAGSKEAAGWTIGRQQRQADRLGRCFRGR